MPDNPIRVLITGWRNWPFAHRDFIWNELDTIWPMSGWPPRNSIIIVHGQCPYGGVDLWAEQWAINRRQRFERHPADWDKYGKPAGMIRNGEMVALGADLCIGFPGPKSRGTWDCLQKATDAGIRNYSKSWHSGIKVASQGA
jgi:hypothetical protein